jgi:ubiquinone biosynthesis protein
VILDILDDFRTEIIEESYGRPLESVFSRFDKEPIGSGAIAQVYRAVLKDGTEVAVKVRHPHIEESIEADLKLLQSFGRFVS